MRLLKKLSAIAAALIPIINCLKVIYDTVIQPLHPHLPKFFAGDGERVIDVRKLLDHAQELYDLVDGLDKIGAEEAAQSLGEDYEQIEADFLSVIGQLALAARAVFAKVEQPKTTA